MPAPPMGISPEVGVSSGFSDRLSIGGSCGCCCCWGGCWWKNVGESVDRRSSWVAGDNWGARCDFRLSFSIRPTAHAWRSTGVLLAAWTNGSLSYFGVSLVSQSTYRPVNVQKVLAESASRQGPWIGTSGSSLRELGGKHHSWEA